MKTLALGLVALVFLGCAAAPADNVESKRRGDRDHGDSLPTDSDCDPLCGARVCGNDPVCGMSCGTCTLPDTCSSAGTCETPSDPDGPEIISLLTNVATLIEGNTLTFTATVTDPQGTSDLVGGALTTPNGAQSYGAFVVGSPGSYSATLTWEQINTVAPIAFDTPAGIERSFRAVFYDQATHSTAQSISVTLDCADAEDAACGGICKNLSYDEDNCGACGRDIGSLECYLGAAVCEPGVSLCDDMCAYNYNDDPFNCGRCGKNCNAEGANENSGWCHEARCSARFEDEDRVNCHTLCAAVDRTCEAGDFVTAWYDEGDGFWGEYREESWNCSTVPPAIFESMTFAGVSCACHEESVQCTPDCDGKVCGSDGCGGVCGLCAEGSACASNGSSCGTP